MTPFLSSCKACLRNLSSKIRILYLKDGLGLGLLRNGAESATKLDGFPQSRVFSTYSRIGGVSTGRLIDPRKEIDACYTKGGGKRYSSALGPKFPLSDGEKIRSNWRPCSQTRFSDLLSQSINHETELQKNKAPQVDISSDDEFAELGPSCTSSHKLDSGSSLQNPHIETKDSVEGAPKAGRVSLEDSTNFINEKKAPEVFKIRISNHAMEISEVAIHDMCSSHGTVSSLVRTKDGAVDILFNVKNKSEAQALVNKLNSINGRTYVSAELPPSESSTLSYENSMDLQYDEVIRSFQKQLELQRIYLEDLEHLHRAILHLKARPSENDFKSGKDEQGSNP